MVDQPFPEPDRATWFEVNRTRIRAWCWGNPQDPPLVVVHGGHDHGRMWDRFAPRLAGLGLHVVAIDQRGHGDSGRLASGMMWSAGAIDICEIARELSLAGEPIGLLGHSMGAGQVLTAAGTAPERVAWVVVLDGLGPPAEAFEEHDLVEAATDALDRIARNRSGPTRPRPSREEMAERRGAINTRLPPDVLAHLARHGTVEVEGGYIWKTDARFNLGLPDGFSVDMVLAGFADVQAPVLALMSSEDDTWSDLGDDEIERRIGLFPDARWRKVPGAGHYVHVEQPDRVLEEIEAFLTEIGAVRAR